MSGQLKVDSGIGQDSLLSKTSSDAAAFAERSYDYLIVGAGTAGLALAARLSESGQYTVGVLEAGISGIGDSIIDIPGKFGAGIGSVYDWRYTTVAGSGDTAGVPSIPWSRGKVLGGSSALNFMIWDRASRAEYDAWEKLGNHGWNWDSMFAYMKKAENYYVPSEQVSALLDIQPSPHDVGTGGPVQVSYTKYASKLSQLWISALESLGIPRNDDPLSGANIGVSNQPANINPSNITRSYSAAAYLTPNAGRKNLFVQTNALVEKINWSIDKRDGNVVASGLTFSNKGNVYTVSALKEVIISGGSVNTPQTLELSGIGSHSVLLAAGVNQVVDLPSVGENLQDHTGTAVVYERSDNGITLDSLRNDSTFAAEQTVLYQMNSDTQPSILAENIPSVAYVSLSALFDNDTAQALVKGAAEHVHGSNVPYKKALLQQLAFLYDDEVAQMELLAGDSFFTRTTLPSPDKTYATFFTAQQHQLSRGSVHIRSSDPAEHPTINPNYFAVPFDVKVATAGTAYIRKIAATPAYSAILGAEVAPGDPDEDLEEYTTRRGLGSEFHPVGTAAMLPRDEGGVVDCKLKVYGTANVRVVDASIIPLHLAAHIQATVYGIAEKAADIILAEA